MRFTQREEDVKTQGEHSKRTQDWMMYLKAKECPRLPEAGREPATEPSPLPSEGAWPCQHLEFGLAACRSERISFYLLNRDPPSLGFLLWQP